MKIGESITEFAVMRPKLVTAVMVIVMIIMAAVATVPSIWPEQFPYLNSLKVDTDPENMLPSDEPVRLYHDAMKKELSLYDILVVGVVNDEHKDGVFNANSLRNIYELTEYAKTLTWPGRENPEQKEGVIEVDIIAPSTVDSMEPGGLGSVKFEWLMAQPPATDKEALEIRRKAMRMPFLKGTLVSEDGKAIAIYLPLTSKDMSHKVSVALQKKIAEFDGNDEFHITGLPVAEDTFGVEMFLQMAISAPVAMLIIFLIMLIFFRKISLIVSPLIVALVSVIMTMALLIITGNTIHIMSSMIPIFIMPIAVLDAVHILSEFFDRYQEYKDKKKTIIAVMKSLFVPMLYTSLTTTVGFASLALTPIPPVQVFGLFIAFGVMTAWILTIVFIPAYIMFMSDKSLENFGLAEGHEEESASLMSRMLQRFGVKTYTMAKLIILGTVVATVIAVYGISMIQINDNPIRWFNKNHPIRIADKVLNEHFGGTYMGYLAFEASEKEIDLEGYLRDVKKELEKKSTDLEENDFIENAGAVFNLLYEEMKRTATPGMTVDKLLEKTAAFILPKMEEAPFEEYDAWSEAQLFIDGERQKSEIFKQPETLKYISELQKYLLTGGIVGKSNSLPDVVKTVYRELMEGNEDYYKIPDSSDAVGQCLLTYQNSHRPRDLWHFTTPDYRKTSVWLQLKSGDNRDMSAVVKMVDDYVDKNPPPMGIHHKWFGLTYINVIWQDKMVSGMFQAFIGSFLAVFLMMTLLYRSSLWGFLCMIPLTVTILLIYGMIGLVGKDYDMPVAVLSALALGLAVDYAIHFLSRSRELREKYGTWKEAVDAVFGEPARAITRNVIVVGVGFMPLLLAPLMPYKTVGMLIASILICAGAATLVILPALIKVLEKFLFPETGAHRVMCNSGTCIISAVTAVALVAVNIHQFVHVGWTALSWVSIISVVVLAALCILNSRSAKCKADKVKK